MNSKALGIIETYGYIGAVESADTALKTADVEILSVEKVRGGLVTLEITGDVSSVSIAVESAKKSCQNLNIQVSTHVIPRLSDEIWDMFPKYKSFVDSKKTSYKDENSNLKENTIQDENSNIEIVDEMQEDSSQIEIIQEDKEKTCQDEQDMKKDCEIKLQEETSDLKEEHDIGKEKSENKKIDKHLYDKMPRNLENMKVVALRNLARKLEGIKIPKSKIKFANKQELIEAIKEYYERKAK